MFVGARYDKYRRLALTLTVELVIGATSGRADGATPHTRNDADEPDERDVAETEPSDDITLRVPI